MRADKTYLVQSFQEESSQVLPCRKQTQKSRAIPFANRAIQLLQGWKIKAEKNNQGGKDFFS
jgi:hypothetical protein